MDFNKSHGCTCSTDKDNLNKVGMGTNLPAADANDSKDKK
jgi:hypothetical protein